ncbi:MAG: hypothetical protein HN389_12390, partial [Clostridia bacterium]|nr:hypothetical protein [Clostridia bacterium]
MKRTAGILIALLFLLPVIILARPALALDADEITFKISEKSADKLFDENVLSYITFDENEHIYIPTQNAVGVMLKWFEPCEYVVTFENEDSSLNDITRFDNSFLNQFIPISDSAIVGIHLPDGGKLSEIIVFKEGEITQQTQVWQPPHEKTDILLVCAHPDDEYLYMGGTIPYYGTELGFHVSVLWLSHGDRARQEEALTAYWAMGSRDYPDFVGFPDSFSKTYERGASNWGEEETLEKIVEAYRKYKPEVVVTHDPKGEYGHGAHMLTSAMSLEAVAAAADPTRFPKSAQQYGTWQVSKLYMHLLGENKIYIAWETPLEAFDGKTAMDMAKIGYSYHRSQHIYNLRVSADSRYACTRFGLAFTNVGEDVLKD